MGPCALLKFLSYTIHDVVGVTTPCWLFVMLLWCYFIQVLHCRVQNKRPHEGKQSICYIIQGLQHSGAAVSTTTSLQVGSAFKPAGWLGPLCVKFPPCLHGFPPGTAVSTVHAG